MTLEDHRVSLVAGPGLWSRVPNVSHDTLHPLSLSKPRSQDIHSSLITTYEEKKNHLYIYTGVRSFK